MSSFRTDIVLSFTTGILLVQGGFGDMVQMAEHVVGHAIWDMELANETFVNQIREEIFKQQPSLRDVEKYDAKGAQGEALRIYIHDYNARQVEKYGPTIELQSSNTQKLN